MDDSWSRDQSCSRLLQRGCGNNTCNNQEQASQISIEKLEKLFTVFKGMGNPFEEESADILVLDTTNIADTAN